MMTLIGHISAQEFAYDGKVVEEMKEGRESERGIGRV
jgi:hypothetical protein